LIRPLCAYPQYPRCTGPTNDGRAATLAANYTGTSP
jgi:feruloyl esterase